MADTLVANNMCVADNFHEGTIDLSRFTVTLPSGGSVGAQPGAVQITWPTPPSMVVPNKGSVTAKGIFDLRGGSVSVDVLTMAGDNADAGLYVELDATHQLVVRVFPAYVRYDQYDGSVYTAEGGVDSLFTPMTVTIAVDAAGQQITFGAGGSSNGMPIAAPFAVDHLTIGFGGGTEYASALAAGSASFDNFSASGPNCP
jgi:hypothetical protein